MAHSGRSWSSVAAGLDSQSTSSTSRPSGTPASNPSRPPQMDSPRERNGQTEPNRSTSPHYTPKTESPEASVYVLTLLTDAKHHQTMTKMREKYFPRRLNRLEAHLTLFHALPGSKLEEVLRPVLLYVSQSTSPFPLLAAKPFRLNKGIAIGVPKMKGGDDARAVHGQLKEAWKDFLSRQDSGGFAAHYTIMNKVDDDAEVQKALAEVEGQWRGCHGTAEGLSLFKYDRGNWIHAEDFRFAGGARQ